MSRPPEQPYPSWRKAAVTLFLFAVLAAVTIGAIVRGDRLLIRPTARAAAEAAPPAFAGASPNRVFLRPVEGREAARRGLIPAGTRSILATGGKLDHGEWRWDDKAVPAGRIAVRVDLERQLVSVFQGADEIGTAVIVYGVEGKETPRGKLPILGKTRDHRSLTYDAPMPFSLWLRDDGVALHGSSVSMGKATNGCIGVPVEFAEKLFEVAREGDIVEVIGGSAGA